WLRGELVEQLRPCPPPLRCPVRGAERSEQRLVVRTEPAHLRSETQRRTEHHAVTPSRSATARSRSSSSYQSTFSVLCALTRSASYAACPIFDTTKSANSSGHSVNRMWQRLQRQN